MGVRLLSLWNSPLNERDECGGLDAGETPAGCGCESGRRLSCSLRQALSVSLRGTGGGIQSVACQQTLPIGLLIGWHEEGTDEAG